MSERLAPEQIAADAIARAVCARQPVAGPKACEAPCPGCLGAGRDAVEAMSAAELVIVSAARMQGLLALERAMAGPLGTIAAERRRQVEGEGWTTAHDDTHLGGEMARAAAVYALNSAGVVRLQFNAETAEVVPQHWPWSLSWYRPAEPCRALVKAGALIVAELERLDRAALAAESARHG